MNEIYRILYLGVQGIFNIADRANTANVIYDPDIILYNLYIYSFSTLMPIKITGNALNKNHNKKVRTKLGGKLNGNFEKPLFFKTRTPPACFAKQNV